MHRGTGADTVNHASGLFHSPGAHPLTVPSACAQCENWSLIGLWGTVTMNSQTWRAFKAVLGVVPALREPVVWGGPAALPFAQSRREAPVVECYHLSQSQVVGCVLLRVCLMGAVLHVVSPLDRGLCAEAALAPSACLSLLSALPCSGRARYCSARRPHTDDRCSAPALRSWKAVL